MEIHQLRYFVTVAETGNFTRASERCNVSQPSLSQQIIKLESEMGHKLFHRLGRKAVLTEIGLTFLERARRILFEIETAGKEIKDSPGTERRIVVGAIPTVMPYLLPIIIAEARRKHPNLVIHAREDFRTPIVKSVMDGELDLALASTPIPDARAAVEPLFTEHLLLAVPEQHHLAARPAVTGADLKDETFILLGHSSALAAQIQQFCGAHDFEPTIGYRCNQLSTVKYFLKMGLGISILPQITRTPERDQGILYRRLSGRPPQREIVLVRHPQRYQTRGAALFLEELRAAIKKHPDITPITATRAAVPSNYE